MVVLTAYAHPTGTGAALMAVVVVVVEEQVTVSSAATAGALGVLGTTSMAMLTHRPVSAAVATAAAAR